jgi:hypothetical protein
MKVNLETAVLYNTDGTIMQEAKKDGTQSNVQLKDLIILALRAAEREKTPNKENQDKDFLLILKFVANPKVLELTSEEISRIKEKLALCYDAWVYGQVSYILEGNADSIKFD